MPQHDHQPIGGYFSLELPLTGEYHAQAIPLNTGRNALEHVLRCRGYQCVHVPYYLCDVVYEPFHKLGIEYRHYHIDDHLELAGPPALAEGEALLYVNYFGLKDTYVALLAEKYGQRLIVDNTQAFYSRPLPGIDTFYTCRKFFGVPDGAYLYTTAQADFTLEQDISYDRMTFLCKRIDQGAEAGYRDFRAESANLVGQDIKRMSHLTRRLMQSIDYEAAARRRRDNYDLLHQALAPTNLLHLERSADSVPMIYPYMTHRDDLRQLLIQQKVFVAQYWGSVLLSAPEGCFEQSLARCMLPLPIDQRYGPEHMQRIIALLKKC